MVTAGTLATKRRRDYGEGHICSTSFYEEDTHDNAIRDDATDASSPAVNHDDPRSSSNDALETTNSTNHTSTCNTNSLSADEQLDDQSSNRNTDGIRKRSNPSNNDPDMLQPQAQSVQNNPGRNIHAHPSSASNNSWPVALYIPNLLGYLRIFLSFIGFQYAMQQSPTMALHTWTAAALLDLIDGAAARKLNQCSDFGIVLDVVADNILRSIVWISSIIESVRGSSSFSSKDNTAMAMEASFAIFIVCLEWITMFCSQSNQLVKRYEGGRRQGDQEKDYNNKSKILTAHVHWKDDNNMHKETPFWVKAVFKNNFRTVPGIFAIFGLFAAPFGMYLWYADGDGVTWPARVLSEEDMAVLIQFALMGRLLAAMVEVWICYDYFGYVVDCDSIGTERSKNL